MEILAGSGLLLNSQRRECNVEHKEMFWDGISVEIPILGASCWDAACTYELSLCQNPVQGIITEKGSQ